MQFTCSVEIDLPVETGKTKYISEIEYTHFKGFMNKMMALHMPGMFKKQTQKWLDQFKAFAEKR